MVNGLQNMTHKTMVVDLDGTYIRGNTLHIYIKTAIKYNLHILRIDRVAAMAILLMLRKCHLIKHVTMKFGCLRLSGREDKLLEQFAEAVKAKINDNVRQLIDQHLSLSGNVLLATAAADFYVCKIWHGDFVATAFNNNPNRTECRGETKVKMVNEWLSRNGSQIHIVITDHPDDLPLLEANHDGVNYIVSRATGDVSTFLGKF
jgi:phosphoserine phosphatase